MGARDRISPGPSRMFPSRTPSMILPPGSNSCTAHTTKSRRITANRSSTASTKAPPYATRLPLLGYAIADTIAIGDPTTTPPCLKAAGTSVAMGNAIHGNPGLLRHHYHRHPRQRSSQRLQDIGAGVTSAKSLPAAGIAQFTVAEEPERNLEISTDLRAMPRRAARRCWYCRKV